MIKISNLHKFFNKGKQNENHVLNDVTVQLPEKGMVAIFGKSGCGKTTLLNVIGGLDSFADGIVSIYGTDIKKSPDMLRNKYMGYIFQNYNLNKDESCFDNVADALRICGMRDKDEIEKRVFSALKNVGMEKYKLRTPDTLSGGQQQRIAIARAIVKNPRIILADEPTGNLDEANTVMIMDLLKAISRDHLVLLVTHEANLVDYYCDKVIELSDGKIVNIKENENADGFSARDKNAIYLGELEKKEYTADGANVEYYGEPAQTPVKLRIVNYGGKIYLSVDSSDVHVLDSTSEIRFKEGVYEQDRKQNEVSRNVDMSSLPPIEGSSFGKLFSLKSSVISGYVANFRKNKKGKKLLKACMSFFAILLVIMSAVFGTVFDDIMEIQSLYNHNIFYVYTDNNEVSEKIYNEAYENGADFIKLQDEAGDSNIRFRTDFFETFSPMGASIRTNAAFLDISAAKNYGAVCGKTKDLADDEMVITTAVADKLIEQSGVGYISNYDDILGFISNSVIIGGYSARVVGIVDSSETAIYLSPLTMAENVMSRFSPNVHPASQYGISVNDGEAQLFKTENNTDTKFPNDGETFKINGCDFKLVKTSRLIYSYDEYLTENSIKKTEISEYIENVPGENKEAAYFEWFDYYYSEFDSFAESRHASLGDDMYLWLYLEKGIDEGKYFYLGDDNYYKAYCFKKENGRYPTKEELENSYDSLPDLKQEMMKYERMYSDEFYSNANFSYMVDCFLVSDNDYIMLSKRVGETHPSISGDFYKEEYVYDEDGFVSIMTSVGDGNISAYTAIHSNNTELTEKWIKDNFSDVSTPGTYYKPVITPSDMEKELMEESSKTITAGLVSMGVILAILCVCMYFIMRSALMSRVKEIGIYRAIGVSRKNITFRFLIESAVLALLTVFVGYLLASAFIWACMGVSPLITDAFFYPWWFALVDLVILAVLCLVCGTLPVIMLLHKTPAEILAKYDV